MALETYRKKRNFAATTEPEGAAPLADSNIFVVQKHDATRLHYDFRLALDGVLKSWAVTRGPSLNPGEKRLAVAVEDHPLEYADFEGTIAKGEYGGGSVIVWDNGTWTPLGDAHRGLKKGHLEFELHGHKLNGRWHLVRMHGKPGEKRENWLLIKGDDEFARSADEADILEERPESISTGRTIDQLEGEAPGWSSKTGAIQKPKKAKDTAKPASASGVLNPKAIKGAEKAPMPGFLEPMLATLSKAPPTGDKWLHEIKFDGYRLQAHIEDGKVTLWTRGGLDWTKKFGAAVPEALRNLPVRTALIDGEMVVENESGVAQFSLLQADLSDGRLDRFAYYAFDCLYLDGQDLREAPLIQRKELLSRLIGASSGAIRYSSHFVEDGKLVLQRACALGLEGIVSKISQSVYVSGRGKSWVKAKCSAQQEFVIAGYVPSSTGRKAIGSLVLGVYDGEALRYVGRVGTGFSSGVAEALFVRLDAMRIRSSPFAKRLSTAEARQVRYVRPELIAEIDFRGWTGDGLLRQASFQGLREDKPAREVVRETTMATNAAPERPKSSVTLTHPDRIYWPDEGVTKEGLADYYAEAWPFMKPLIVNRALALVRCPDGIGGQTFFQKHAWKGLNRNIALVKDPEEPEPLISIRDFDGLMALVQSAALEIHPWGSTVTDWERPDMIVMDLDPGEDVDWTSVIAAGEEVRDRLKNVGLAAFVKTSGGKGLHVVSPIKPKAEWPAVKAFTKSMADSMAADSPDRFVSTIPKARRHGKILIDYLRNQRGMTAVSAYSTRARPGAAVSMPLAWEELSPEIGPAYFTIRNAPARLSSVADPWADFRSAAAPIEAEGKKAKPTRKR
ncbi:MAG TPA: DNA ligase D [Roseiarcus sp.]|jgi:bifunctional non-homologous end joining protein LigD